MLLLLANTHNLSHEIRRIPAPYGFENSNFLMMIKWCRSITSTFRCWQVEKIICHTKFRSRTKVEQSKMDGCFFLHYYYIRQSVGMVWTDLPLAVWNLKFQVRRGKKIYKLTNDWIPTPRTIIDTWVVNRTFVRSHFNFIQCAHVWILEIQIYLWLLSQAINRLLSNKTKKNLNWQMFPSTWTHSRT